MNRDLGMYIKEIRKQKGISQRELGRRTGISKSYIQTIEAGKNKKPSIIILLKICNELDANFFDLVYKAGYTQQELDSMGTINNISGHFNITGSDKEKKYTIIDENKNERISIIKILNGYKNNNLNLSETLGLLSILLNENIIDYISTKELEENNIDNIICGIKKGI